MRALWDRLAFIARNGSDLPVEPIVPPCKPERRTPADDRLEASWIGWEVKDLWLKEEDEYQEWFARLDARICARGWRYLRRRNTIDIIVEKPGGGADLLIPQTFPAVDRRAGAG